MARPEPKAARLWFASYVQTYLERDVRAVSAIRDLSTFRRLLGLLATRTGQIVNKTDLAAPLGVSVPTITEWLSILEITGQIALVPPHFESFGKRVVYRGAQAGSATTALRPGVRALPLSATLGLIE